MSFRVVHYWDHARIFNLGFRAEQWLLNDHEFLPRDHRIAFDSLYVCDSTGRGSLDLIFHFHCLHHHQPVALAHDVANGDQHLDDQSRHWGFHDGLPFWFLLQAGKLLQIGKMFIDNRADHAATGMNHHEMIIAFFYPEIEAPAIENEAEVI